MKKIFLMVFLAGCFYRADAQNQALNILNKTLANFNTITSLSYKEKFIEKNPFSNGDTSLGTTDATLIFDSGLMIEMNEKTVINKGQIIYRNILRHDTLFTMDLVDSIHSFKKLKAKESTDNDFTKIINNLKNDIVAYRGKIFQKGDTVIDNNTCYNFSVTTYDSIKNGNHNYVKYNLAINKSTLLPVYYRNEMVGSAQKDGHDLGRLSFFTENYFTGFKFNEKVDPENFHFNKDGFSVPNDKMLADGTKTPELKLRDLANNELAVSAFKNKLLLVEFGATNCGANPLANPLLNRLNSKYASNDFSIVAIYSSETADQVKKYIESNKLGFPVYLGNLKTRKAFKTTGTPNFYLISKNGSIIKSFDGYSDDLEKNLSDKIDETLNSEK